MLSAGGQEGGDTVLRLYISQSVGKCLDYGKWKDSPVSSIWEIVTSSRGGARVPAGPRQEHIPILSREILSVLGWAL